MTVMTRVPRICHVPLGQDRVMAENNDLKMEVENLRTEVALLTPESERNTCSIKMESGTADRRSSRYEWFFSSVTDRIANQP